MSDDPRLDSMLSLWQQEWRNGRDVPAEQLCADRPDLLPVLRPQLDALRQVEKLRGVSVPPPPDSAVVAAPLESITEVHDQTLASIANYQVVGELGRGAMGVVWKAFDPRLNRVVALKQLLVENPLPDLRARFRREAEAVARLVHPHIAQVYSSGEDEKGQPYFIMEYVEGGSLHKAIASGPQKINDSARLVMLLARAVQAAHAKGIVHRDLKPANILLAPPADEPALNSAWGCPKISDFGLARDLEDAQVRTMDGALMGTPAYMAPEQAEGRTREVGPFTDVYALGVILYQLLTGVVPFRGATVFETLGKVVSEPPQAPSILRPELSPALEAICLKCLAKTAGDRPASAGALAAALAEFLSERASALQLPEPRAASNPRRRLLVRVGVGSVVAAALLVALVATLWPRRRSVTQSPVNPPAPPAAVVVPLDPEVTVRIGTGEPVKSWRVLGEAGALPVRAGDLVRVDVDLKAPGHVYLVLLTSQGEVVPLYPWNRGEELEVDDVNAAPPVVAASRSAGTPTRVNGGWPFDDVPGLETFLVLARPTPLPAGVRLRGLIGAVPRGDLTQVRDEREAAVLKLDAGGAPASALLALSRGIERRVKSVDDPVLAMMERLHAEFDAVRAVRFAHTGKGK